MSRRPAPPPPAPALSTAKPTIEVTHHSKAEQVRAHVTVGQHFVFCEDGITAKKRGRLARLLGYKEDASAKNVVPLLDDPVELPGTPPPWSRGRGGRSRSASMARCCSPASSTPRTPRGSPSTAPTSRPCRR